MDTPLITILVATYNRANYIRQAIASAQNQSYKKWELLVLDDASTDDTEEIVAEIGEKDHRVKYIKQKSNVGIAQNRNTGLARARGACVAILDSDDVWTDSKKLEKQVAFLQKNPDCALVGTWVKIIDEQDSERGYIKYKTDDSGIRCKFLLRNQFAQSSVMYRTAAAKEAGGYDAAYRVNDDYDLWLKIGLTHKLANLPEYTTSYREHSKGITKEKRIFAADEHIRIIRKYKKNYPCYPAALIKGYARVVLALMGF